jgi:putative tRNA adenosine deaminase-associated protein
VPADAGSVGMVSVADEFFVIVRVLGDDVRLLISDIGMALDYSLADDVLHHLEIPLPEDEDDIIPGGDIRILDEFGIGGDEIELICDDDDLYPDQALAAFARRIGFGDQFDAVLESLPR